MHACLPNGEVVRMCSAGSVITITDAHAPTLYYYNSFGIGSQAKSMLNINVPTTFLCVSEKLTKCTNKEIRGSPLRCLN